MSNLIDKKAPINYKFQQQYQQQPQDQLGKSFESDREYRLKLREQERQRMNNQNGEEGLKYGALQIKPAEIIKPTDLIDHEYHFKSQNNQMQNNQINGQIQYNPIDMNYLSKIKTNQQNPYNQQQFSQNYQNQYNVPENQNYQLNQSINDRDYIQNQVDYNQQYIPNQINISQQFNQQYDLQNQQIPKLNNENQLLRRSSKSKLNFEKAKELDQNLSQIVHKDSEINQQNNFINYRMQDQAQKRQKQIEYQEMLDKQRAEKQQINQNQVQSPQQTGRIKEKLYSARKLSQNIDDPQQQANIQNNQKMQYARSNSQYQESRNQDRQQEDQFQKQQNNPIRRMSSFNQEQQLLGRESKQNDSLIFGGYLQIGNPEMKDKQEKIRKQKEYRDYLDMQKNQDKNRFDNIPIQKPPIPAGPNQISKQLNRPPSGIQKAQIPRQENKNDSFINQGKSNWDEHFLQERRTQIGDQIFEQVLKKQAPQNQKIVLQNQDIRFSEQYLGQQNRNPQQSRQQMRSIDFKEQNPFVQQSEETNKQKDIDRKKEYAMELQKQINEKKQMKERQNSIDISKPQKNQEFMNINQHENKFQNQIDSFSYPQDVYRIPQEQQLNYNQNENHQYQAYPQEYQNDFIWDQQMENDPLFQQILERKKQELMRKYQEDDQLDQQYQNQNINYLQQPQFIDHGQKPSDIQYNFQENDQKQNQIQPNQYSEADLKRLKREEYKRELDEQVRLKEQTKTQKQGNQEKPIQKEQDHIQQKQVVNEDINHQNIDMMRVGVRNRTDITKVDNQENKEMLIKKLAYQEELKLQMEEKQRQKEFEKERSKKEEEKIEREILLQRQILEQKENKELIKEGKIIQDDKPKRQINRQQFETSDVIIGQQNSNVNKIEQTQQHQIQEKMEYQDESYIKQEYNIQQEYNMKQDFDDRNIISQQDLQKDFAINNGYQQEQLYQPLKLNQLTNYIPAPQQIDPQTIQIHHKLLEDQQKMIQMYQQALGQILDFRYNYVKESQDMQLVFMKERNQVLADLHNQNAPHNLGIPHQNDEIKKQENEISSLNAIQLQLNQLMNKINTNKQKSNSQFTSIINPQVQQNLNELIKTQRDKIVRMSQTLSFREDISGVNEKTIIKNQQYPQFMPQYDHNIQHRLPFDQFDQSLASHSKLIKVPNQFTNKLKEKADNFEQQRLLNLSPNKVPQFTNTQDNIPSDNNTSWFEHQQKSGNSPRRIVNPNNKTNNMTNLYQTWQLGPESQASINQRVSSVSPNKNQYQKAMQASLAGSSHLQYINQNFEIQGQEYIQSPNQAQNNSQSPQSRQILHGNNMNQRPLTNNIFPQDTIEELPEREQNMEDDNSTYLDENQVINLAEQSQPIHQNKSAYLKDNEEIIKQNIHKKQPFQQNSNMKFRGLNQQSIETDQDINNRDDEMTQYSKSVQNRKSKVLSSKNQGFQNQLDANMQYIEQQVNQGQIHGRANSYSRSPLQNDQINNHFSPIVANQMINIGQVLANAHNKPTIQINTQKSFYKPPLNVINQSNNNMAATGMAGAKPSITGSSFYNATMAKTKQQELIQEQELQKQLMKIFNSAEIFSNNDEEDQKSNIKYQNKNEEEQKKNESNQRTGQTQFRRKKQYKGNVQQQQFEDTEYLESASNINIAQSVAQSMDTNNNLLNFNQILQQPYQQNQAVKGTVSGQFNLNNQNKQNLQRPVNLFYTQNATFKNDSIIDQQQYSWLMQNNNNIISEQQELEQSKSKSKDEEIVTEYENTVGQTSSRPMQINHIQSQSQLESRQDFQRQNKSELGQTNISEAIWDDPDILPEDDNIENEDKDFLESGTNKQSYIQEIYDQNSDAMQFDGTNGSNLPQFKIVSIKDENIQKGSLKSNFQNQNIKNNGIIISNQQNLNQSYNTNIRQMNVQASQPYSINQAYNFEPKEDSEVPTSLNHQYNYEDEHSEKQQLSSMKKNYNQKQDANIKNDSAISGLNLCNGLYQESEPTSAVIIMNDQDFQKLKMYQPVLQTISDKEIDPVKKALENELIDQIYEIRNQNRQSYTNKETFQVQKNMDQQQAERIQKNMILLNQMSSSQDNLKNQKIIHPQRQYNPKQYEINTIKEEGEYSSNLQTREVDPILNSTPSLIKINSQISNENPILQTNEFKIDLQKTQQNQIEIQKILSEDQDQSHLNNESFQENSQSKQYNNAFQSSLTNEYQSKNEEDFQEIIKEKLNKINNIFNFDKIDNINQNKDQNQLQINDCERQLSTPGKNEKKEIEIEKCSSPRPFKNNISDAKNQELEDLARLIQQATGSVNNIVENSQQLMHSRQHDRMAAAKLRAKQKANGSSVNTTQQSHKIIRKKQEDNSIDHHLVQEDLKNQQIFHDKIENSQSDIKILSNLDQLIQNLEKQQEENIQFQNKFSSSKAYIQDDKQKEQIYGSTLNQLNQNEIMKEYIKEEDLNNSQIQEILQRNIHNSQQKQNPNSYVGERMQTAENKVQMLKIRNIMDSECNTEIKEAIMVDQKYQLKLQKQYIRPISGKSALSTSTNRYATSCQTQHVNINSNIKKQEKQIEYQEFNDDDDEAKNIYGHEQDSN